MTKEEFRDLPKEAKLVQIIYDYKKGVFHIRYFSHQYYKNFGNFKIDIINKYNNHYITRTCSGSPEMWCTENKLRTALENFNNILVKREKDVIKEALTNIEIIKNNNVMIDTSLLN